VSPNAPVLKDPALQRHYEEHGYATFRALSGEVVRELRDCYRSLGVEDTYRIGYHVSLYSGEMSVRRKAHDTLVETAFPALAPFLVDRRPYMATFLVKEPRGRLITPHQDWSHGDETRHDSVMAWIPLCDADERNGGLGFVKGSHRYFDYLRAFPYQEAATPIDVHGERVTPYLNVLRLEAGEVVLFNNRIFHGSLPNDTEEPRTAFSFALHPEGEPLLFHYIKPNGRRDTLLRYAVDPGFYLEYQNPRLRALYDRRGVVEGHACEEVAYAVPAVDWEDLEARMLASGNERDPWKAARAEEAALAHRSRS
jgi:hypothetical protein